MTEKKWILKEIDTGKVHELKRQLGRTRETLCALFVSRGLDSFEKAKSFFAPSLSEMHCPTQMKDMRPATQRVTAAIRNHEKILLFGDYDVDGTTAVAMMLRFLRSRYIAENVLFYIPDRYLEGYGLSREGIAYARQHEVSLIITLDCGITAADLMAEANDIDFIICDHHLPGPSLPQVAAILNPRQTDCRYPYKDICGTAVAFKLIKALCAEMQLPDENYLCYLDLVALATGADVVPIRDENRVFVHHGLLRLNNSPCAGIKALKMLDSPDGTVYNLTKVIFGLAPKINAAGRMDHGNRAVKLLAEDDEEKAAKLAATLFAHNEQRKATDIAVTREALEMLQQRDGTAPLKSSVAYKDGWHKGVIGIVASRLIETYYRPTIVLTTGGTYVSGSARSIQGFNIYEAINRCSEYLVKFGGHFAAAGVTLLPENVDAFAEKFETIVAETITADVAVPKIIIDLEIFLPDIDYIFFNTLRRMEPFGHGNDEPVFLTRNIVLHPESKIVGEKHVRFVIPAGDRNFLTGIGFNLKNQFEAIGKATPIDIVYNISENEWNNRKSLQLKILDIRPHE